MKQWAGERKKLTQIHSANALWLITKIINPLFGSGFFTHHTIREIVLFCPNNDQRQFTFDYIQIEDNEIYFQLITQKKLLFHQQCIKFFFVYVFCDHFVLLILMKCECIWRDKKSWWFIFVSCRNKIFHAWIK
jgi:hypothetical protein